MRHCDTEGDITFVVSLVTTNQSTVRIGDNLALRLAFPSLHRHIDWVQGTQTLIAPNS